MFSYILRCIRCIRCIRCLLIFLVWRSQVSRSYMFSGRSLTCQHATRHDIIMHKHEHFIFIHIVISNGSNTYDSICMTMKLLPDEQRYHSTRLDAAAPMLLKTTHKQISTKPVSQNKWDTLRSFLHVISNNLRLCLCFQFYEFFPQTPQTSLSLCLVLGIEWNQ